MGANHRLHTKTILRHINTDKEAILDTVTGVWHKQKTIKLNHKFTSHPAFLSYHRGLMGPGVSPGGLYCVSIHTNEDRNCHEKLKLTNYVTLTTSDSRCPKMYFVLVQISEVCFSFLLSVHGWFSHFLVYISDCCDWFTKNIAGRGKKTRVRLIYSTARRCHSASLPHYVKLKIAGRRTINRTHTNKTAGSFLTTVN